MSFWNAHAKISIESLADPKMEEQNLQSVIALVLPSSKKQYVSNLASRKVNSISIHPIKAYDAQKGEAKQYEYKSKGIKVNKSCATPTKKNSRGLKKDHGQFGKNRGVIRKRLKQHKLNGNYHDTNYKHSSKKDKPNTEIQVAREGHIQPTLQNGFKGEVCLQPCTLEVCRCKSCFHSPTPL